MNATRGTVKTLFPLPPLFIVEKKKKKTILNEFRNTTSKMQDKYRTHHQCTPSSANTTKPYLKTAASFISIKALEIWQLPSHSHQHPSAAVPQNRAFLNTESNLVLQQPAHHHFLLSSFLLKREVSLLWIHSMNNSTEFTTTTTGIFLFFLCILTFLVISSGQQTPKYFSIDKKQPFLLGEQRWDTEVILQPVINYFMKSQLNYSQVYNSYLSDWASWWIGETVKAQNWNNQIASPSTGNQSNLSWDTWEKFTVWLKLVLNTTHDS